jgi:hypothetical protein
MKPKGSLVIDEVVLPIQDIYLRRGEIVFIGRAVGPLPAVTTTSCTIHDADGGIVTRGVDLSPLSWDTVPAGKWLEIHMPLLMNGVGGPTHVGVDHPHHRQARGVEKLFGKSYPVD